MTDLSTGGLVHGKRAIVTGGGRGLGLAIARRLAAAGATGACLDLAAPGEALPDGWIGATADVGDEAALTEAMAAAVGRLGGCDIVVANAGVVPPWRRIEELDLDEWDAVFRVNVRGVAATLKAAVPHMKARGGAIVVMASLNARRAHGSQCLYTASKHAALGIARAAALDLGRYGIRVNALAPGPIATAALTQRVAHRAGDGGPAPEAAFAALAAETALGRIATEDEVAAAALFLASDLAAGITGVLLPIDAGLA